MEKSLNLKPVNDVIQLYIDSLSDYELEMKRVRKLELELIRGLLGLDIPNPSYSSFLGLSQISKLSRELELLTKSKDNVDNYPFDLSKSPGLFVEPLNETNPFIFMHYYGLPLLQDHCNSVLRVDCSV